MVVRKIVFVALLAAIGTAFLAGDRQRELCQRTSKYNTIFVTEDSQGLRTLRFERNGARQSVVKLGDPDHLELPYTRAILSGFIFCQQPRRVLIVGLGGGTIPMFLRKHWPDLTIDVVEIDGGVFDVAKQYFGFREDPKMHVFIDDGRRFIANCRDPYDLIFLDAFDRDSVPYQLTTREFLRLTRRAITPGGALVGNIWDRGSNRLHDAMVRTYQDVFDDVYLFPVPYVGNEILVALPRQARLSSDQLARRAADLSRQRKFPFDLGTLVGNSFQHLMEKDPLAQVLEDGREPAAAKAN